MHNCETTYHRNRKPRGKGPDYERNCELAFRSRDTRWQKMCLFKDSYESIESAEATIRWRTAVSGQYLRWYECPCCGKYHITHKQPLKAA